MTKIEELPKSLLDENSIDKKNLWTQALTFTILRSLKFKDLIQIAESAPNLKDKTSKYSRLDYFFINDQLCQDISLAEYGIGCAQE